MTRSLVSIVIGNYNYGRFVRDAIDSALAQSYADVEVIVVDDGSADDSRGVIASYGSRIYPVFQSNRGMGSAWNTGFAVSHGDVVLFLDADDMLSPSAVAASVEAFSDPRVVKVHWPLWEMNANCVQTGRILPREVLDAGDYRQATIEHGPDSYLSPPTSGNAWSRAFLQQVLPMPEQTFRQHADTYLYTLAPIFGRVCTLPNPQAFYRVHGSNDYAGRSADEKNHRNLEYFEHRSRALARQLARQGVAVDPCVWKERNGYYEWMARLDRSFDEIKRLVPPGATYILADQSEWTDDWGDSEPIAQRHALPIVEHDGRYWGPPPDGVAAIAEIERLRNLGARFAVFGWPSFWWLDHYPELRRHLYATHALLLANDRVVVFDLCRRSA